MFGIFVQLIHRPRRTKISLTKTQTLPNFKLPISYGVKWLNADNICLSHELTHVAIFYSAEL